VIHAALELADDGHFRSLSMRKVAAKLGVEAMSLYNHVAGKQDLVEALVDVVCSEVETGVATPGSDWRAAMRDRAVSVRAALSRHRWAVGLMANAVRAYSVVDTYVYGFALLERVMPSDAPDGDYHEAEFLFGLELILDGLELQPSCSASPMMMPSGPRTKQSR